MTRSKILKAWWVYLIPILITTMSYSYASKHSFDLENKLTTSMKLNKMTKERIGDSGRAIRSYIRNGYLKKKPSLRADYTDYWILKKPVTFMGQQLIVIEEEYMSKYIGCCVSPGVGVVLKVKKNLSLIESFAKSNGCSLEKGIEVKNELRMIKANVNNASKYVSLSCRERDIPAGYFISTNDKEYMVEYNTHGAVLTSVKGKNKLYLGNKCDASSKLYGKGIWSKKYGGFIIQFGTKKIAFPRQDIKVNQNQGC